MSFLPGLIVISCLGVAAGEPALAVTDPDDEQSIDSGAQLYQLYCSECHGMDANSGYADVDEASEVNVRENYAELIEIVRVLGAPEPAMVPVEDWPEWAEGPAPLEVREPDVREEVMSAVTGAIDNYQDFATDMNELDPWQGQTDEIQSDDLPLQMPVATNLADPAAYYYGTSEQDVFNSIATGTGSAMHSWRVELGSDEAVWDIVNYIRSRWDEAWLYR
jgi:mono/diheme cytochrome c family protein